MTRPAGFPQLRSRLTFGLTLAAAVILFHSSAQGGEVQLSKGDRIVFLGDSITQAGAGPNGYVTLVREALAKSHANLELEVIGAGISGNKVPDLEKRLDRDVLSHKPTKVVIYIGINDVWHSTRGQGTPKDAYEAGLRSLIRRIADAGASVILCTPSVIGEAAEGMNSLDGLLAEYADISRKVAADTKTPLLDLRAQFLAHLKEHNNDNKAKGVLTTDGVHLNASGNQFVAARMLSALGAGGKGKGKVLRHVVLFKFKETSSAEDVEKIVSEFRKLPERIDAIADFEWGTDVSPEMLQDGFTHCFFVTFRSEEGRDAYLPHPAHEAFVSILRPHLEKVLVVDYWAQK